MKSIRVAVSALLLIFCATLVFLGCGNDGPSGVSVPDQRVEKINQAEKEYQQSADKERARENYILLIWQHASALEREGKPAEALVWYQKALETDPENLRALYFVGKVQVEAGLHPDAAANLEKVMEKDPGFTSELYIYLGKAYMGAGRLDDAQKALLKNLVMDPANVEAYRLLAEVQKKQGLVDQASSTEALAQDVSTYGYLDRGHQEKPLSEWLSLAGLGEAGSTVAPAPDKAGRALAAYNAATYFDRQVEGENLISYEKALKQWRVYLGLTKELKEEKPYRDCIKARAKALKSRKKAIIKKHGMIGIEGLKGESKSLNENLAIWVSIRPKLVEKARAAGDPALIEMAENLLGGLDPAPIRARLQKFNQELTQVMMKRIEGKIDDFELQAEEKRFKAELEVMMAEFEAQGLPQIRERLKVLSERLDYKIPQHEGEEEED